MRTTVNIDDGLLTQARQLAVRSHRSLGAVVDDALRVLFAQRRDDGAGTDVELPVYGGTGLQPGVDLEDREGLAALLDDAPGPRAAG